MKRITFLSIVAIFISIGSAHADPSLVQTKYGPVSGVVTDQTVVFKGIPYAAAPSGDLRWQAPREPAPWSGTLSASQFSDVCPQINPDDKTKSLGSEDCLKLNIWRPKQSDHLLPVMLFIHGGGNTVGTSYENLYGQNIFDGSRLVADGAVVVTINYRLGALGFLAHAALKGADGQEGNYASLDQIQALKFVRDNIQAFGGDPANVTVFGESAGAIDALVLIASPQAKGLFHRAIVESGFLYEFSRADAEVQGIAFAKAAGCDQGDIAACLRALPVDRLVTTTAQLSAGSLAIASGTIDGVVLKKTVLETIRAGEHNRMPVIIGTNHDEMRTLAPALFNISSTFNDSDYLQMLTEQFGSSLALQIHGRYTAVAHGSALFGFEDALSDYYLHCPTRRLTRALVSSNSSTYRYVFSHAFDNPMLASYGAGHGLELPYVFGTLSPMVNSAREVTLSSDVQQYWTTFAKSGNPQVVGQTSWANGAADAYLNLDVTPAMQSKFHDSDCDFWDTAL